MTLLSKKNIDVYMHWIYYSIINYNTNAVIMAQEALSDPTILQLFSRPHLLMLLEYKLAFDSASL